MFRPWVLRKQGLINITKGLKAPCPKQAQLLHEHYINCVTLISSSSNGESYDNTFIGHKMKWSNQENRGRNMSWEDDDTWPRCENHMPPKIPRPSISCGRGATCQVAHSVKRSMFIMYKSRERSRVLWESGIVSRGRWKRFLQRGQNTRTQSSSARGRRGNSTYVGWRGWI